jgi:hypothetical protein
MVLTFIVVFVLTLLVMAPLVGPYELLLAIVIAAAAAVLLTQRRRAPVAKD